MADKTTAIGTPGVPWGDAEIATWSSRQARKRRLPGRRGSMRSIAFATASTWSSTAGSTYGVDAYPLYAIRSPSLERRVADRAGDRRRAWLRNQRRAWRAAVRRAARGRLRRPHQPRWSSPASAHGATSACTAGTCTPWIQPVVPRRQSSRGIGRVDAPGRADPRSRAAAYRPARNTDSDETEFRPALAARDGKEFEPEGIPDGFYVVDDSNIRNPASSTRSSKRRQGHPHRAGRRETARSSARPWSPPESSNIRSSSFGLCAGITQGRVTGRPPRSIRTAPVQRRSNATRRRRSRVWAAIDYALAHRQAD
jgi:hypothetical protein